LAFRQSSDDPGEYSRSTYPRAARARNKQYRGGFFVLMGEDVVAPRSALQKQDDCAKDDNLIRGRTR
jgi:hypothetical protein